MLDTLKFWERVNTLSLVVLAAIFSVASFVFLGGQQDAHLSAELPALDQILFAPDTTMERVDSADLVQIELSSGGIFGATLAGDLEFEIQTPAFRVRSSENEVWVTWDATRQSGTVHALQHPAWVEFLSSSGETLATLPVPEGSFVNIPLSKIQERLSRLRLAKLQKEFPTQDWKPADLDPFVQTSIASANAVYQAFQLEQESAIRRQAVSAPNGGFLHFLEAHLTWMPEAQQEHQVERADASLQLAMNAFLNGDDETGAEALKIWSESAELSSELLNLYSRLFYVLPGDSLYEVKQVAGTWVAQSDPESVLRHSYDEIQDLLRRGDTASAQSAFDAYQARFLDSMHSGFFDSTEGRLLLSQHHSLLFELLQNQPALFSVSHFQFLLTVERQILSAYSAESDDLDEERQSFIQNKLALVHNLVDYGRARKIPISDAAEMADELLFSADEDLREVTSQSAILSFYKDELSRLSLSVDFMKTPEFFTYENFDEGLAAYEKKTQDLNELNQYLSDLKKGSETEEDAPSLEDAVKEMGSILSQNAIAYESVESMDDAGLRLFELQGASLNGVPFEGRADRISHILYDLKVDGHEFQSGVLIEQLARVIQELQKIDGALESEILPISSVNPVQPSSLTDQVMREQAILLFDEVDLDPKSLTWTVEDRALKTIRFEGEILGVNATISGVLNLDTRRVQSIEAQLPDGQKMTLPSVPLSSLKLALDETLQSVN